MGSMQNVLIVELKYIVPVARLGYEILKAASRIKDLSRIQSKTRQLEEFKLEKKILAFSTCQNQAWSF